MLDVAPIEINGRTLVPLRFIAEHFGARDITYDPATEVVTLELEDASVLRIEISRLNELIVSLQNENAKLKGEIESLQQRIRELEDQKPPPTEPSVQPPFAPQNLQARFSDQSVVLTWSPSAMGTYPIAGYKLYKRDSTKGFFALESLIPASSLLFIDKYVLEGGSYTYYLKAYDNQIPANESTESMQIIVQVPKKQPPSPPPTPPSDETIGKSRNKPVPFGQSFITSEGFQITVTKLTKGQEAWEILKEANRFNDPPETGMQYIFVTVKIKNISSKEEPAYISDLFTSFVGSSNKIINTYDKSAVQPRDGIYQEIYAHLYHGGETTGSIVFYIPTSETNMRLVWNHSLFDKEKIIYFEIK